MPEYVNLGEELRKLEESDPDVRAATNQFNELRDHALLGREGQVNPKALLIVRGVCPAHGEQVFDRNEQAAWWECPMYCRPATDGEYCTSVIPDEEITKDGADVIQWGRKVSPPWPANQT